ncbi:MAG TPA: LuxR C-terminal-related transcriptional regulator [Acidimicrobiia bacterium]
MPPFVGRDAELSAIAARADAARAGRASIVWIEAEAGEGKTALARAAIARLGPHFTVRTAAGDELAGEASLYVAQQLAPVSSSHGFSAGLELLDAIAALESSGPVALVVEDLHWADALSRQALLTAARRLGDDPVLLVVTSRPGGPADGWERLALDDGVLHIRLAPLSEREVMDLAAMHGVELSLAAAERLTEHTRGQALHVRTLLSELTPAQLCAPEGALPAPRSLAMTVVARMAELPADARTFASALAVLNERSPVDRVARVAAVGDPMPALDALLSSGLLDWAPEEVGTPVWFAHPLYRAAIYEDLAPTVRHDLHRRAADVIGGVGALAHRVRVADSDDVALADDLDRAAGDCEARGDRGAAARFWSWAAALTPDVRLGDLRRADAVRALLFERQIGPAAARRDEMRDHPPSAARSLVLGLVAWNEGDEPAALSSLTDAAQLAAVGSAPRVARAALVGLAVAHRSLAHGVDAETVADELLVRADLDDDQALEAWSTRAVGVAVQRGPSAGIDVLRERLPDDATAVAPADAQLLATRGTLNYFGARTHAAIADIRVAIQLARRDGAHAGFPRAHLHLGQALVWAGDWDEALVQLHVAQALVDEGQPWMRAQVHAALANLLAVRGDWPASDAEMRAAEDLAAIGSTSFEVAATIRVAHAARAQARHDAAAVVAALEPIAAGPIPMMTPMSWWPSLIGALIDIGDLDAAREHLDRAEGTAGPRGLPLAARLMGRQAHLAAAAGDVDGAEAGYRAALDAVTPDDPRLDEALLHRGLGALLLARGSRRAATAELRTAYERLDRLGAAPYRDVVQDDLAAAGARAPDDDERGERSPLDLTERERDVAVVIARGLTNKEAAAELYVSTKAVEYHLTNIYGKLGISSRRQLAAALARS